MSRSLKKGPYLDQNLMKKISNMKAGDRTVVKTWARDATITPEMVGFTFGVHNGKDFISVTAQEEMVGHRLGEFSPTTKFVRHGGRMQREIEAAAAAPASAPAGATAGKPAGKEDLPAGKAGKPAKEGK
ncbi:MAG: 30S ribosomal protein S19 [Candidatus Wildermuthbacteria bacterium]|nr:30S ribosomal protein S19 [Candidatus Wildermuthbacteria bacterium]